jgi:hypothetical protein
MARYVTCCRAEHGGRRRASPPRRTAGPSSGPAGGSWSTAAGSSSRTAAALSRFNLTIIENTHTNTRDMFFFWRKKYKGQLNERAVARTGELRHGAPAALPVAEDEADELLVLFRRPRALLQPHLLAARLPPHFFLTKNYCLIKNNEAMAAAQALCSGGARPIPTCLYKGAERRT